MMVPSTKSDKMPLGYVKPHSDCKWFHKIQEKSSWGTLYRKDWKRQFMIWNYRKYFRVGVEEDEKAQSSFRFFSTAARHRGCEGTSPHFFAAETFRSLFPSKEPRQILTDGCLSAVIIDTFTSRTAKTATAKKSKALLIEASVSITAGIGYCDYLGTWPK